MFKKIVSAIVENNNENSMTELNEANRIFNNQKKVINPRQIHISNFSNIDNNVNNNDNNNNNNNNKLKTSSLLIRKKLLPNQIYKKKYGVYKFKIDTKLWKKYENDSKIIFKDFITLYSKKYECSICNKLYEGFRNIGNLKCKRMHSFCCGHGNNVNGCIKYDHSQKKSVWIKKNNQTESFPLFLINYLDESSLKRIKIIEIEQIPIFSRVIIKRRKNNNKKEEEEKKKF